MIFLAQGLRKGKHETEGKTYTKISYSKSKSTRQSHLDTEGAATLATPRCHHSFLLEL